MKITTTPHELQEGLFGQVVLFVMEILPYLERSSLFPSWDVKSKLYGSAPDYTVIPGLFDPVVVHPSRWCREVRLRVLRLRHLSALGGDWHYIHRLWHSYFRVSPRITAQADLVDIQPDTLALHYRGNDKNTSAWDTNPVSQEDFLRLVKDFLKSHPAVRSIFLATDEFSMVERVRKELSSFAVTNLGEVGFHKSPEAIEHKGDRAVLDCVLLSRCRYLIKGSSALSAFAKVLNPELEAYRVSASKMFSDVPYFPDAYIPRLTSSDPECSSILARQMMGDWCDSPELVARFGNGFRAEPRYKGRARFLRWLRSLVPRP